MMKCFKESKHFLTGVHAKVPQHIIRIMRGGLRQPCNDEQVGVLQRRLIDRLGMRGERAAARYVGNLFVGGRQHPVGGPKAVARTYGHHLERSVNVLENNKYLHVTALTQ